MKTVVLVGSLYPYYGEETEVWGCSRAIKAKRRSVPLTRFYHMDDMRKFRSGEWAQKNLREVGKIKIHDFPIITCTVYPEFPTTRAYDRDAAFEYFGVDYYTCSICYMIADAIREGYEKIIVHRIHEHVWSIDYIGQKAGLDFWCGMAMGKGILVEVSEDSALCRPYFWELDAYGYTPEDWTQEDYDREYSATQILVDAVKKIADSVGKDYRPRPTTLIPLFEKKR